MDLTIFLKIPFGIGNFEWDWEGTKSSILALTCAMILKPNQSATRAIAKFNKCDSSFTLNDPTRNKSACCKNFK